MTRRSFPLSIEAPGADIVRIDDDFIRKGCHLSRRSPRQRIALPLHKSGEDPLQRMVNVLQPGTYIRPHRHSRPESILLLRGELLWIVFTEEGRIRESDALSSSTGRHGVDLGAGLYHTLLATRKDTVIHEARSGPWHPHATKDFAPWSPPEDSPAAARRYLGELERECRRR